MQYKYQYNASEDEEEQTDIITDIFKPPPG